ncbi:AAA family ATPase [Stenotrophomonas maltophilia]
MQHPSSADGGATLHLLCGKIGAGKSTLSQQLAAKPRHVLISEDAWLATLHPGEIHSVADYLQRAATLRSVLTDHLRTLLRAGVSVVLDFPFNTPATRGWAREVFSPAERGLGDVKALGSAADVFIFGDGHEVAQLAEVEHKTLRDSR